MSFLVVEMNKDQEPDRFGEIQSGPLMHKAETSAELNRILETLVTNGKHWAVFDDENLVKLRIRVFESVTRTYKV